jgi:hypothetical protein
MTARTLVIVCLLVLAGCTTPFEPSAATGTDTAGPTAGGGATPSATPTERVGTAAPSANPWGDEPIVVAVRDAGERDGGVESVVREATRFWEENDDAYLGFQVRYEVRPDARNPDLVVAVTDQLPECQGVSDAVGCAPRLTDARMVDRPETVWVKAGLSDRSTTLVTKHELGHTLGLDHGDAPRSVMQARSVIYTEPQPNATERAFPWADGDFTVRVDAENASNPDVVDRQVGHTLSYYEADAPGMPDDLSFSRTGASDAEIRVRFGEAENCRASSGSCVSTYGTDPDGDGAIETYTRVEITLVGLDADAVGWHVGYWLAHAFGAEADGEKPPPFRDAGYRERRSAWWE